MTKAVKVDIASIMLRMDRLVIKPHEDEVVKLADVNILQEDLNKITTKGDDCLARGSTFDTETFDCDRKSLIEWRSLVNEKRSFLTHKESEERKASTTRTYKIKRWTGLVSYHMTHGLLFLNFGKRRPRSCQMSTISASTC